MIWIVGSGRFWRFDLGFGQAVCVDDVVLPVYVKVY